MDFVDLLWNRLVNPLNPVNPRISHKSVDFIEIHGFTVDSVDFINQNTSVSGMSSSMDGLSDERPIVKKYSASSNTFTFLLSALSHLRPSIPVSWLVVSDLLLFSSERHEKYVLDVLKLISCTGLKTKLWHCLVETNNMKRCASVDTS